MANNRAPQEPSEELDAGAQFRWRQSRENLYTPTGLRRFQIAYAHKGEEYEAARAAIDKEYDILLGQTSERHGKYFATYINLLEELGFMHRKKEGERVILASTPAGDQVALLLKPLPDVLRVMPYFVVEILMRYRLNNPLTQSRKNQALAKEISESDVFPYWSLYKIMRLVDGHLTKDELARFVFKLKRMADIPATAEKILSYRKARSSGKAESVLNQEFGEPLVGAVGQSKYIIGRAGFQVGVILQNGDDFRLNEDYLPFIDQLLASEPTFEELDETTWMRKYGAPAQAAAPVFVPFQESALEEPRASILPDNDPIYLETRQLLEVDEFAGVILAGPPGTGKTWYARQIALKLTDGRQSRIREVQFHPAYQYEDFVEGYIPDGVGGFKLTDRHLLEMCSLAYASNDLHVLVIDELSRTDPARVMGEAMTYMESTLRGEPFYLPSGRRAVIPKNLLFIATMNPEDRSVDEIDAAMDRRWGKVYLAPDVDVLESFLAQGTFGGAAKGGIRKFFSWVQPHYKLGHAFFRTTTDAASLNRLWRNQLRFLFERAFRHDPDTLKEITDAWQTMIGEVEKIEEAHGPS